MYSKCAQLSQSCGQVLVRWEGVGGPGAPRGGRSADPTVSLFYCFGVFYGSVVLTASLFYVVRRREGEEWTKSSTVPADVIKG